jgi:LDH2 family malate/lactate/ureidoglycolate dehydrogenase
MVDCMKEVGTPVDKASMLAANLTEADFRGHFSHGLNRLVPVSCISISSEKFLTNFYPSFVKKLSTKK